MITKWMENFSLWGPSNQMVFSFAMLLATFVLIVLFGIWVSTMLRPLYEKRADEELEQAARDLDVARAELTAVRNAYGLKDSSPGPATPPPATPAPAPPAPSEPFPLREVKAMLTECFGEAEQAAKRKAREQERQAQAVERERQAKLHQELSPKEVVIHDTNGDAGPRPAGRAPGG